MFIIIQILAVIAMIAVLIFYFGKIKHAPKVLIASLVFCIAVSAWISNAVLSIIPLPTGQVVITATGEKNEFANSNEIFISNILVGGEEYEITNPSEGKWFWYSNYYIWRNENDKRQPKGTTRSITLDIPFGRDRSILFGRSQWSGIVDVSYDGETKSYDLFKPSDSDDKTGLYASINDTNSFALYGIKMLRVGLFLLIIALLMIFPIRTAVRFGYGTITTFFEKHWDKLVYIIIAVACYAFMFELGKKGSLWFDEVWMVGAYLTDNPVNNIFSDFIQRIWTKYMPYGQEYLLALSELLVAFSIYTLGLIGNKLKGKRLGIILSSLCAASSTIIYQCGIEFRYYPFALFFSVLTVYMFIKKQNELGSEKKLTLMLYGLCLTLLMDTYTFGLVTAGIIMFFDFVLIVARKSKVKGLIEFILPAIYGVYWLISHFVSSLQSYALYNWVPKPTIRNAVNCIIYLCGGNYWQFVLFVVGAVLITLDLLSKAKRSEFDFKHDYILLVFIGTPLLVFIVNIIASNVLQQSSLFLNRYFISIIVFFVLTIGNAIDVIIESASKNIKFKDQGIVSLAITFAFTISSCTISWLNQQADTRDNYKETAENLMVQNDIYLDSTICIVYGTEDVNNGFEYYLTHNGKRDPIKHEALGYNFTLYDTVYVVHWHYGSIDETQYTDAGYKKVSENISLRIKKFVRDT